MKNKIVRITTVPISLKLLITGQMKFMKSHGFEVVMMSADGPEIDEVVNREECPHEVVPLTRQITPVADLKALWTLYRKLRRHKPQIVHTHTPKAGLIGMMASWLARVPIRIHTVAGLPLEATSGIKRKVLVIVEKLTYWSATEVWPNSHSLRSFILENGLTKLSKVNIIGKGSSNGIDVKEFSAEVLDSSVLNEIKEKINYQNTSRYLLFVGRMVKDKGVEELVSAFTRLKEENSDLKLILVGPLEADLDPLSSVIMRRIESDTDIIAVGFSNHVKYYMHLADLFVFPSHREGFPNVPMQAGLMGCPVVASKINGNVDIIEDGLDGILHTKGNEDDLFDKMDFALKNPTIMTDMVQLLNEKIKNNFERKIIQAEILKVYKNLLKNNVKYVKDA